MSFESNSLMHILRLSKAALWKYDLAEESFVLFNDAYDLFSYASANEVESIQRLFETWIHPEDLSGAWNILYETMHGGPELEGDELVPAMFEFQARVIDRFGNVRQTRQAGTVFFDENGDPIKILGIVFDISAEKARETELRESESRYRTLFEESNDGILIIENERIVQFNRKALELFGGDKKKHLNGCRLSDMFPANQPNGYPSGTFFEACIERCYKERTANFDWWFVRADHREFQANVSLVMVPFKGKSLLTVVVRDVTEQNRAYRALEHYRAYLAVIAESRKFFYGRSEEDIIRIFLDALAQHFGISKLWFGVYNGNSIRPVVHGGDSRSFVDIIRAEMAPPKHEDEQWIGVPRPIGGEKDESSTLFPGAKAIIEKRPIVLENLEKNPAFAPWRSFTEHSGLRAVACIPFEVEGRIEGVFVFYSDKAKLFEDSVVDYLQSGVVEIARILSKKRLWEQQQLALKDAKDKAEAASQAKMRFIAGISHEIRTPMTAILGYAEMLLDKDTSEEHRRDIAKIIRTNGEYLLGILNDTLDFSKLESARITIEWQEVLILPFLNEIVSFYSIIAREKNLSFELLAKTPIPESFRTDTYRLKQILLNLIGNALKFTSEGGVSVNLYWQSEEGEKDFGYGEDELSGWLCFEVSDTGIGISKEQMETIFKPFRQGDSSTSRVFGGSGLGLTISSMLAQLLHGRITAKSEFGHGSEFALRLKQHIPGGTHWLEPNSIPDYIDSNIVPKTSKMTVAENKTPLTGKRILLVEDAEDNLRLFERILEIAGAEVYTASNGKIATEIVLDRGNKIDLILMDIQMPIMDGITAAKIIRENGFKMPMIALTAHSITENRDIEDAGFDDYVTKPILRKKLLEAIRKLI